MSNEELIETLEREWKSLMNRINEIEEEIISIRARIEEKESAE